MGDDDDGVEMPIQVSSSSLGKMIQARLVSCMERVSYADNNYLKDMIRLTKSESLRNVFLVPSKTHQYHH